MMPNSNFTTDAESSGKWLTTSQAAAQLKVSEKTIQRRAAVGKLPSRKEKRETGIVLLVQIENVISDDRVTTGDDTVSRDRVAVTTPTMRLVTTGDDTEKSSDDRVTTPNGVMPEIELLRDQRQQDREEIKFLRGLVEQRDRDAAELRAALRKALEAAPRQLMSGNSTEATEAPATSASDVLPIAPIKKTHKAPEREPRPLWKLILGVR